MVSARNTYIFDIDGTLADCSKRLPLILDNDPPKWDEFEALTGSDTLIYGAAKMLWLASLSPFTDIVLLTSRSEGNRAATMAWLSHYGLPYDHLEMRKNGDQRDAHIVKAERLKMMELEPYRVITVFEDDAKVVKHLRTLGYHVCQVDDREYVTVPDRPKK